MRATTTGRSGVSRCVSVNLRLYLIHFHQGQYVTPPVRALSFVQWLVTAEALILSLKYSLCLISYLSITLTAIELAVTISPLNRPDV